MKKTYITNMPDKAGTFLLAGKIIESEHANITRVSYNKAVDIHTLFIEVEAESNVIARITDKLKKIGYLTETPEEKKTLLIEVKLADRPGALIPVLEAIEHRRLNISYMSSQEDGSGYQHFKLGLLIDGNDDTGSFLDEASRLCELRIIDYEQSEKSLDNTIYYMSFANEISRKMKLSAEASQELIINSNKVMQLLDERGMMPYRTFELIGKFADFIAESVGEKYVPRVTLLFPRDDITLYVVEPPCGSNTYIFSVGDKMLFIDSGFACCWEYLNGILRKHIAGYDEAEKSIAITHADIDHCGEMDTFKTAYVSRTMNENFELERMGQPNFREKNRLHEPYCVISKLLTGYKAPSGDNFVFFDTEESIANDGGLIRYSGSFDFCGLRFEAFSGAGGHVRSETMYICESLKLAFSGDVSVNLHGFTPLQEQFNNIAPVLMSGTDTDIELARSVRKEFYSLLKSRGGEYTVCVGHGSPMRK